MIIILFVNGNGHRMTNLQSTKKERMKEKEKREEINDI
jgi:hypothetical protein